MTMHSLVEIKKEIRLLIEYAAPEDLREEAMHLVDRYEPDIIALRVFHHFYSYLPEAREDIVRVIRQLSRRQGTFLLCATTDVDDYLYLVTSERAEFVGNLKEGLWDKDILDFFEISSPEDFQKRFKDLDSVPVHLPAPLDTRLCPVCLVEHGDCHTLGCPVEVCPWCDGQLTSCQCRFSQLNQESLTSKRHLDALQELLEEKGRIPFNAEADRPAYPEPTDLLHKKDD